MHQTKCNGELPRFHFFETNVKFSTAILYDVHHNRNGYKSGFGIKSKRKANPYFQKNNDADKQSRYFLIITGKSLSH